MAAIDPIEVLFLVYSFIGTYIISLFFFIYIKNRRTIYEHNKPKIVPISIVIPCYNESKLIGNTIEHLQKSDYPKNMIEILIVDDKSTDNSVEVIKSYMKIYKNIRLIQLKKNSGGAAIPTNTGIVKAKHDYVATLDAETFPNPDALSKMLALLQKDKNNAGVTCSILVKNPRSIIQKAQSIEYDMTAFTRKLLDYVDSVYVTPGAFSLYKKEAIIKVGLFDPKNLTQDIDIVWRLISHGYKVKMCLSAKAQTEAPEKIRTWWNQRIRWNIGGTQTILKHRSLVFKHGMLGNFIIPFFAISLLLGVFGLGLFIYLFAKNIFIYYLSTQYALYISSSVLSVYQTSLTPSLINFFGLMVLIIGLWMTFFSIGIIRYIEPRKHNILNVIMYMLIYSIIYPFILLHAIYKMIIGSYKW